MFSLFPRQALFAHCMSRPRTAAAPRIAPAPFTGHPGERAGCIPQRRRGSVRIHL